MKHGQSVATSFVAAVFALAASACGDGDEPRSSELPSGGGGGTGGSGGQAIIVGGSGGAAGSGGGAGAGGAGLAGSAGSGGGPAGTAPPEAPEPALDCRAQVSGTYCLSAAGFIDGETFDFSCTADLGGYRGRYDGGYALNCDTAAGHVFDFHLSFPGGAPGPFEYPVSTEFAGDVQLRVTNTQTSEGASHSAGNLESGTVSGTLSSVAGNDVVSGEFQARWLGGVAGCEACVAVSLKGTFRAVFDF